MNIDEWGRVIELCEGVDTAETITFLGHGHTIPFNAINGYKYILT